MVDETATPLRNALRAEIGKRKNVSLRLEPKESIETAKVRTPRADAALSPHERRGIYRVIHERRDVRSEFLPDPIPNAVLSRVLHAAHHAPSVGFMQPWDFLLIQDIAVRSRIHEHFAEMKDSSDIYHGERRDLYRSTKLAGILECPLNVCITCDRARQKGHGLGRQSDPLTDLYSTVCAVQNFWLAARAESLGVGWVSILDIEVVKQILNIPPEVHPVAYLCVGYVSEFAERPDLERNGWETRSALSDFLHFDNWTQRDPQRIAAICPGT
jgi:5,6-dimethylbenzimidazole synthase